MTPRGHPTDTFVRSEARQGLGVVGTALFQGRLVHLFRKPDAIALLRWILPEAPCS